VVVAGSIRGMRDMAGSLASMPPEWRLRLD
jgi:hypothetical protein